MGFGDMVYAPRFNPSELNTRTKCKKHPNSDWITRLYVTLVNPLQYMYRLPPLQSFTLGFISLELAELEASESLDSGLHHGLNHHGLNFLKLVEI